MATAVFIHHRATPTTIANGNLGCAKGIPLGRQDLHHVIVENSRGDGVVRVGLRVSDLEIGDDVVSVKLQSLMH